MSESEIKACPFCGGPAHLKRWPVPKIFETDLDYQCWSVECDADHAYRCPSGKHYLCRSKDDALVAWQRRPAEDALQARVEEANKQRDAHRIQLNEMSGDLEQVRFERDDLIAERDELKARVEELEGIIASTRDGNLTALCDANNTLKAKLDALQAHHSDTEAVCGMGAKAIKELTEERDQLKAKLAEAQSENNILRGMTARLMPCRYCGVNDMAKCPKGFPGCGLADDLVCAEEELLQQLKAKLAKCEEALRWYAEATGWHDRGQRARQAKEETRHER